MGDEPIVEVLAEEWAAILALGGGLTPDEWSRPTECPGWTVLDLVSHLIGIERTLLGEGPPPPVPAADHVRNDVGAMNERWVAERRGRAGPDVMAEFAEVTAARLDALRAMPAERFEETGPSPVGVVPYREFMAVRVMDCWVHEQDMRVATDRVRRFEGEAATVAMGRIASAMPFVVGKRAGAPEGSSVRIEVGPPTGPIHIEVRDGRARAVGALRGEPTVTVVMDADALWRLGCGRIQGSAARQAGMVTVAGDGALGAAVVDAMAFMI